MSVLELIDVAYTYPGAERPSLCSVNLEVEAGEFVVLAGLSGSGKSTLLRAVSGLVPHFHGGRFAGRAIVAGLDTRTHRPADLARHVGTVFQDPETQVVMGTVRAEVAFGLENRGDGAAAVARGVEEAALSLGIAHLLDRSTHELSGGELQRVALAAALAGRPEILVLDEPTSQLDPVAGEELIASLRRLGEDGEATILLCEHRLERCLGFADRVIALHGGAIVCDAAPPEFLAWACAHRPALATPGARLLHGLGLPPAAGVRAARRRLRAAGIELPSERAVLAAPDPVSSPPALGLNNVWHELRDGPAILRGVTLQIRPGEKVALMGRNGAGKSTLLRHAAGLLRATRGTVVPAGRVALLLQNPTDYLVHDTVAAEAAPAALRRAGLDPDALAARHPRELSGGERQRLALAVVLGEDPTGAAVVALDEPTRGMDSALKRALATWLAELPCAVIVATHDAEFAAALARRVVLLADGQVIADGGTAEVLSGGTYFATETARILKGAAGALTPEAAITLLAGETVAA